jgi:hypothetical protein
MTIERRKTAAAKIEALPLRPTKNHAALIRMTLMETQANSRP